MTISSAIKVPPEGYTYLFGQRVSLLEYYKQQNIPHKLCPACHTYAPLTAFRKQGNWWVCNACAKAERGNGW